MLNRSISLRFAAVIFLASAACGYHSAANASETKQITRTVTINALSDNPKLEAAVNAICADKAVKLSDKAKAMCESHNWPNLTKSLRFRNAGVGAEFNALAAQRM